MISKNTNSYYDWYPGKGYNNIIFGNKQHFSKTADTAVKVTYDTINLKKLPFFLYEIDEKFDTSAVIVKKEIVIKR